VQFTPIVKILLIVNIVLWLVGTVILQGYVLDNNYVFYWLGMIPNSTVFQFKLWQPMTYMFFHSSHINHILFNMLLLWWVGSQIELTMGSKRFLRFYLTCGVGAGLLYLTVLYGLYFTIGLENTRVLYDPVIGASGAVFGLLVAYALFHGENVIYFMMLFPMKAKYFVALLIIIECYVLLSQGFSGPVANLAHLGGIAVAFLYFYIEKWWMRRLTNKLLKTPTARRLKLVVDNERKTETFH
jgi:membrane associated rhomboid family serine protease